MDGLMTNKAEMMAEIFRLEVWRLREAKNLTAKQAARRKELAKGMAAADWKRADIARAFGLKFSDVNALLM